VGADLPPLRVVAGALVDTDGRVLIAERPAGKSLAGRWEFPGGKRLASETAHVALLRELREELGIDVSASAPLITVTHRYPGAPNAVEIECWRVSAWHGAPQGLDGQRLRWCTRAELVGADILEADRAIVTALVLPHGFICEPRAGALGAHLDRPGDAGRIAWLVNAPEPERRLIDRAAARGDLLVVIDPQRPPASGLGSAHTRLDAIRPASSRLAPAGAFVRSIAEARIARNAGADYLLLTGPGLSPRDLESIAAVGLPWYLGSATHDGRVPLATGYFVGEPVDDAPFAA
jgi:mutator protein MutT